MSDEVKNYITPGGYRRLQEELARLWKVERPPIVATVAWAAGNGDRSENADYIYGKRRLREIDRRIRYLSKSLDRAVVVDNSGKTHQRVHFGATVTVLYESGDEREVTIVGVDELDSGDARVSCRSSPHMATPSRDGSSRSPARSCTSTRARCIRPCTASNRNAG
jgi:transcription elongation factor GreB